MWSSTPGQSCAKGPALRSVFWGHRWSPVPSLGLEAFAIPRFIPRKQVGTRGTDAQVTTFPREQAGSQEVSVGASAAQGQGCLRSPAWVRLDRLDPMGRVFRQGKQLAEGEKGQK